MRGRLQTFQQIAEYIFTFELNNPCPLCKTRGFTFFRDMFGIPKTCKEILHGAWKLCMDNMHGTCWMCRSIMHGASKPCTSNMHRIIAPCINNLIEFIMSCRIILHCPFEPSTTRKHDIFCYVVSSHWFSFLTDWKKCLEDWLAVVTAHRW